MTPEGKVKKAILKYLNMLESKGLPIFFDVRSAGGFNYKSGIPDIWLSYNGFHMEIEVKTPGGTQSPEQEKYEDIFRSLNIPCYCVDDVKYVKHMIKAVDEIYEETKVTYRNLIERIDYLLRKDGFVWKERIKIKSLI